MTPVQMDLPLPLRRATAQTLPYHLDQLSAFCKAHPANPKILFVPSPQVGYNLTTAMAARGCAWANLRALTPAALAEARVAPLLLADGWKRLVQGTDLFFLDDLLAKTLAANPETFFNAQSQSAGLKQSLLRTLHALRLGGLRAEHLRSAPRLRTRQLAPLYEAYCKKLAEARLFDLACLFERAIEALRREHEKSGSVFREHGLYAILDETPLSTLAHRFVAAVCRDTIVRIGRTGFQTDPPKEASVVRFSASSRLKSATCEEGARFGRLSCSHLTKICGIQSVGAETEIYAVLRKILRLRIPFDQVEIAYTSERPCLARAYGAAERYDVPVTFASGIPVRLTRPGQALLGLFAWVLSGLSAAELIGPCRAGLIDFGDGVPAQDAAALLRQARVGRGRERYLAAFRRLRDEERPRTRGRTTERRIIAGIERLLGLVPEGPTTLEAVCKACVTFLNAFAPVRGDMDAKALESLKDRLDEIGRTVRMKGALKPLLSHLNGLFRLHKAGASVARPGCLNVVPLDRAGYTARGHLFILGMDAASFPGPALEDPILLDRERAQLPGDLVLQSAAPDRKVWQIERLLGLNHRTVTLVSRSDRLAEACYPSALFGQAAPGIGHETGIETDGVAPRLDAALDDAEALTAVRGSRGIRDRLRLAYPWLARGQEAVAVRDRPTLTRFDGWLGRPTPELGISDGRTPLSASRLETLTRCPYRYFLKYVLKVAPPEEPDEDPSHWLTPLEFGRLVHDLFRDFMRALKARKQQPDSEKHLDLLNGMLREHVAEWAATSPPPNEVSYRADCRRLAQVCELFLRAESGRKVQPFDFEISFGFQERDGTHRPDPVLLRLSESVILLLRGRIDRVDRVGEKLQIWDYKTGSSAPYPAGDLLKGGLNLQWALYAYVLDHILNGPEPGEAVESAGYFFVGAREYGKRSISVLPSRSALARLLEPLFELVSGGGFFHVQKEKQCRYCDYAQVCAPEHRLRRHLDAICSATSELPDLVANLRRWIGD